MSIWHPFLNKNKERQGQSENELVNIEHEENEPQYPSVPIRDIKKYLVNEFDKSRSLEEQLIEKDEQIEALQITENKYKATLVTLEEYSRRLEKKDSQIEQVKQKVENKQKEIGDLNEKVNDLKINAYQKEGFRAEVVKDTKRSMAQLLNDKIDSHSGVLPKGLIKEWLEEVQNDQ